MTTSRDKLASDIRKVRAAGENRIVWSQRVADVVSVEHEKVLFLFAIAAECARNRELSIDALERMVEDILAKVPHA